MTAEQFINQEEYDGVEPALYFHGETWDFFESKMQGFAQRKVAEFTFTLIRNGLLSPEHYEKITELLNEFDKGL